MADVGQDGIGERRKIVVRGKDAGAVAKAVSAVNDLLGRLKADRSPI